MAENKKSTGVRLTIVLEICGTNKTDNPDGIYDDCKFSIISDSDIPPSIWYY